MMDSIHRTAKKVFAITDFLAGVCFFSVMALILVNILMRKLFNMPIMGTFELVGLLTATGLGFSLANCEMNSGNVAMSIITDKLPPKIQRVIEIMVFLISLIFWVLVAMRIFSNGSASLKSGWVSSTASLPIYPFIFLMFFNVFCLCLVLALKLTDSFCGAVVLFGKGKVSK